MATTSCTIQERGMKMAEEFFDWVIEVLDTFCEWLNDIAILVFGFLLIILTLPIWIIPFAFWYFRVYKPQQDEPKELSDTWKQNTMSRFERVE